MQKEQLQILAGNRSSGRNCRTLSSGRLPPTEAFHKYSSVPVVPGRKDYIGASCDTGSLSPVAQVQTGQMLVQLQRLHSQLGATSSQKSSALVVAIELPSPTGSEKGSTCLSESSLIAVSRQMSLRWCLLHRHWIPFSKPTAMCCRHPVLQGLYTHRHTDTQTHTHTHRNP